MKKLLAVIMLAFALKVSAQVSCVCVTNTPAQTTGWYAWIPTTDTAWLTQMTNFLRWMDTAAPLPTEYPWPVYGRYTTNNTVSFVRRTNVWGNAQWVARMPYIAGQVWQMRYTRTAVPDTVTSLGSDIVNGYYEYSLSGSTPTGLIYARRLR